MWSQARDEFYRLGHAEAALVALAARSTLGGEALSIGDFVEAAEPIRSQFGEGGGGNTVEDTIAQLHSAGVLSRRDNVSSRSTAVHTRAQDLDVQEALSSFGALPNAEVAKPVWVHLQPFTFCNLECLHCYCFSSPKAPKFLRTVDEWRSCIQSLDNYGIADVYITGGETLIVEEVWELIAEIRDRGMGAGLSTNALYLNERIISNLQRYRIDTLQVSLDGGTLQTHEYLRGKVGSFEKTVENISELARYTNPVINTTINRLNIDEMTKIVQIGQGIGVAKYKFYPQKGCGRGAMMQDDILSDQEVKERLIPMCLEISNSYGVQIETIELGDLCGSARSGFSIDEKGDAYPCIFGISNNAMKCGNIFSDEIDKIWFDAAPMETLRSVQGQPCRACEDYAT